MRTTTSKAAIGTMSTPEYLDNNSPAIVKHDNSTVATDTRSSKAHSAATAARKKSEANKSEVARKPLASIVGEKANSVRLTSPP